MKVLFMMLGGSAVVLFLLLSGLVGAWVFTKMKSASDALERFGAPGLPPGAK